MTPRLASFLIICAAVVIVAITLKLTGTTQFPTLVSELSFSGPTYQPITPESGSVLAWIPYWDQRSAVASLRSHAAEIDYIGVFWYALLHDGAIGQYPYATIDPSIIRFAHENNIKVLAVLANLPTENEGGDWDSERVDRVISSPEARRQHIADIMTLVNQHSFDGINIDYEALTEDQRDDFTAFISELASSLHARGKILGVSLHPKFEENNPSYTNGSQAQDYAALATAADHLYVMSYEQHWETSAAGPIASTSWSRPILEFAQSHIPQEKLFAGLPLYGYDWPEGESAEGLTYGELQLLLRRYPVTPEWDEDAEEWTFSYLDPNGREHEVWYQDARAVAAKRALFHELLIPNVALWRIGNEDPAVWQHLPTKSLVPSVSPG